MLLVQKVHSPEEPISRVTKSGNKSPLRNLVSSLNQDSKGSKQSTETEREGANIEPEAINLQIQELEVKNKELFEKLEDTQDKYKRALAETENVRQRMRRQIDEAKMFGIQAFCKDLLEVADVLAKATESVPSTELNNNNQHLKTLYDGLRMTESQLQKVFRLYGLNQINPIGEKFDPNLHEALFEDKFEGKDPGTVAVVSKVGYTLHNRTIRPAAVGVVKAA
uniref:GrpE protein homolog n=1 Tax=Strigamia maritima TaxID=126957 RepID=T1IYX4_STRMM